MVLQIEMSGNGSAMACSCLRFNLFAGGPQRYGR
jgi:hypothetical protein